MRSALLKALRPALALLVLPIACAVPEPVTCAAHEQHASTETLYFGTLRPSGTVGPADWEAFVADVVTPAFPDGLTWWSAQGQWHGDAGLVREASYVLQIAVPPQSAVDSRVDGIISAYKQRFEQSSVLRLRSPACLSFNL